eukprot:118430_1
MELDVVKWIILRESTLKLVQTQLMSLNEILVTEFYEPDELFVSFGAWRGIQKSKNSVAKTVCALRQTSICVVHSVRVWQQYVCTSTKSTNNIFFWNDDDYITTMSTDMLFLCDEEISEAVQFIEIPNPVDNPLLLPPTNNVGRFQVDESLRPHYLQLSLWIVNSKIRSASPSSLPSSEASLHSAAVVLKHTISPQKPRPIQIYCSALDRVHEATTGSASTEIGEVEDERNTVEEPREIEKEIVQTRDFPSAVQEDLSVEPVDKDRLKRLVVSTLLRLKTSQNLMDRTINKCHLARDDVEKQQSDGVEFSREGTEKRGAKSSKFIQFTKPETLDAALQKRMLISFLEEREERGERKSGKVSGMKSSFYSQLVGMVSGRGSRSDKILHAELYQTWKQNACTIQRVFRGQLGRRKAIARRVQLMRVTRSATIIQRCMRRWREKIKVDKQRILAEQLLDLDLDLSFSSTTSASSRTPSKQSRKPTSRVPLSSSSVTGSTPGSSKRSTRVTSSNRRSSRRSADKLKMFKRNSRRLSSSSSFVVESNPSSMKKTASCETCSSKSSK